jgi:hypothetical protein
MSGASSTTYLCDRGCILKHGTYYAYVGGNGSPIGECGANYFYLAMMASTAYAGRGAALSYV